LGGGKVVKSVSQHIASVVTIDTILVKRYTAPERTARAFPLLKPEEMLVK